MSKREKFEIIIGARTVLAIVAVIAAVTVMRIVLHAFGV